MIEIINEVTIDKSLNEKIPESSVFFDIETTGFSRSKNRIYLIGYLIKSARNYIFKQLMTQSQADEKEMLRTFLDDIKSFDNLITFNGHAFDIPFVKERAAKYFIKDNLSDFTSIDIYKDIKTRAHLLGLKDYKLKTIEAYLGIDREDIFSGGELISLYYEYEATKDAKLEKVLLLHNREDILNLPGLVSIYDHLDRSNTISIGSESFIIDAISISQKSLSVSGRSTIDKAYFTDGSFELKSLDRSFDFNSKVLVSSYDHKRKCIYVDNRSLNLVSNYDYRAPDDIYLLKLDRTILYKNIRDYLAKILADRL